jgi:hypothetical protein
MWVLIMTDSSTRDLWQIPAEIPTSESLETCREMAMNFTNEISLSYFEGFLTCREILRHGVDGVISAPKEVVLRIFIALQNQSLSAGLEPRTFGPVASTITIRPRWAYKLWRCSLYSFINPPVVSFAFPHSQTPPVGSGNTNVNSLSHIRIVKDQAAFTVI